ncbi:uncharacterized protein [Euwallacea fornicatus]|uniref:uncharacterized protein isoform X1 n=1 Tax=Euwallacea fornicatus TaxID=995702 RepID=UPI00338E9956
MGTSSADTEFSSLQFEKTLTNLKDSQESINQCCQWCLNNRQHYKKIVTAWLNVIKRVKIEQRLVLFYLANDVVQYSKRRNYEYVDTWGTAIQKATTMVRDEKVKHKILRIFKIWEQRAVYGDEFIADLCGLINIQPTGPKNDEPHEFQTTYIINKIKNCANLEKDTDTKLKSLKEHNPKIQISEALVNSLKDRAHVDDVEKELDVYVDHMESYINALKLEIKNRIALISALRQAETQLESDRKDVKTVAHAYKTFGQRVRTVQKKLEERMPTLPSPVPSPDINAPSPSPEEDLELPEDDSSKINNADKSLEVVYSNPGFYVPPPSANSVASQSFNSSFNNSTLSSSMADTSTSFLSNGFTSFLGQNMSFDISNISTTGLFSNSNSNMSTGSVTQTTNSYSSVPKPVAPPSTPVMPPVVDLTNDVEVHAPYNPLLPPPVPPFTKNNDFGFNNSMDISTGNSYDPSFQNNVSGYNPEISLSEGNYESWDRAENPAWNEIKGTDTPESPPTFEKAGYGDPVEYHDSLAPSSGAVDVDQRVIPGMGDIEDSQGSLGGKDVDHRNLISLTGSPETPVNGQPKALPARGNLKTITTEESLWKEALDQDYRKLPPLPPNEPPSSIPVVKDQDYRLPFNMTAPPPPPPPPIHQEKASTKRKPPPPPPLPASRSAGDPRLRYLGQSPRKSDFIGGDVDMDLSDDLETILGGGALEPPPPLPDLLDDVDANQFLDEISTDFNEFSNLSADFASRENGENVPDGDSSNSNQDPNAWSPLRPPPMAFGMGGPAGMGNPPPFPPSMPPPGGFMMNAIRMGNPGQSLLTTTPPPHTPNRNWDEDDDENPYLNDDDEDPGFNNQMNRIAMNNFRGGFDHNISKGGNLPSGAFRGRGRAWSGSQRVDRGRGRGLNRGGRGMKSLFRPRGKFRGRFSRGGF